MPLEIDIETSVEYEQARAALRAERDRRLTECDWTMLRDVPEETSAIYMDYRQALRDITTNASVTLETVEWPEIPAGDEHASPD